MEQNQHQEQAILLYIITVIKMVKRNKLINKIVRIAFPIVGIIFMVTLFAIFWSFLIENKWYVLAVSGGIIILFALLGYFNPKKFKRGFKKRLR